MRESIKVLQECAEIQDRKSRDYQNPNSHVAVSHETRRRVGDVDASTRGRMEFQLVERVARARERLFVVGATVQVVEGKLWHGPSRARAQVAHVNALAERAHRSTRRDATRRARARVAAESQ